MKQELNYNIHNILKFKIVHDKKFNFVKDLNLQYSFFEEKEVDDPDIVVNIGNFTPSNDNCYVVDHKYYIKENYFYCKDSEGRAKWEVEIFGFEKGNTIINFDFKILRNRLLMPFIPVENFLLEPLICYKLSKKGYFLIHSAAVSKDKNAYLLAGRGGAFKTTLVMDFVRRGGFDFLGDDKVIIAKNKVLSYPINFISFKFRCEHLPTESAHGALNRIRLLRYIRRNYDRMNDLRNDTIESSMLKALFFIVKKNQQKLVLRDNFDLKKAIDKLVINNKMEMSAPSVMPTITGLTSNHFFRYMLSYSFVFPNNQITEYWDDLERNLHETLEKIPIYEIEVPYKYNLSMFNEVRRYINDD